MVGSLLPPIRSLVDTSLEEDEIDYYDDDEGNTPTPKHFEIQTCNNSKRLEQRRRDIPMRNTSAPLPLFSNPTITTTTLPTTSSHHQLPYCNFSSLASNTSHSNNAVPITPLHYIPYVHGGYSAAAPLFVTHSKFAYLLKKLLPGAYEELSILLRACEINGGATAAAATTGHDDDDDDDDVEASSGGGRKYHCRQQGTDISSSAHHRDNYSESTHLDIMINNTTLSNYTTKKTSSSIPVSAGTKAATATETAQVILADPVKIMKWAENNPVVSAFGIWNSDSGRRTFTFMKGVMPAVRKESNDDNDGNDNDISYDYGWYEDNNNDPLHNRHNPPPFHIQRPKRRKQPLPEDLPSSSESHISLIVTGDPIERPPCYNKPALEWDIFLDPNLVRQVDAAMAVVDNLGLEVRKAAMRRERRLAAASKGNTKNAHPHHKSMYTLSNARYEYCKSMSVSSNAENSKVNADGGKADEEEDNYDFDILQSHTAAQVEVDRLVSQLMRRTILAHGSMSQLVLEAFGVAPTYNFGSVVKSSRDGSGNGSPLLRTPSRTRKFNSFHLGERKRGGSLNTTQTWDETEERLDFEALLDPSIVNKTDGKSEHKGGKRKTGSQGMFMETWIHTFARTLSLLARSSKSSGREDALVKTDSSNSSRSIDNMQRHLVENIPGVGKQQGFSGLIEKIFLRRERSVADPNICVQGMSVDTNNFDDADSDLLTNHDMLSPTEHTSNSMFGSLCGMSLCLGMGSDDAKGGESSTFPFNPHLSHKMAQDIEIIATALGEPLRLVLDLKSRRVPPRVWSRLIDSLRTQGLIIEGIGSFDMDELRVIGKGCSYPLISILFFHSVGDLQRACHANEVKDGDHVYFNGGSLMWKRTSIMEAAERGCCGALQSERSSTTVKSPTAGAGGNYSFQPYAFPRSALSDWERIMCKSTIEDYRRHFNLKIGVYVQEFSINAEALDALTIFINKHGEIYDQGLAFGGVNGLAVKNIHGDGYWNQRYMGRPWDFNARPSSEMTPLKPEDHHLVQKVHAPWGQVGTIFEVMDDEAGSLTAPREPCDVINMVNSSF